MVLRPVAVPADVAGRLWFSAMPGRFESWASFVDAARRADLRLVVCLTPLDEMSSLSPAYRLAIDQGDLPFGWRHAPMRNFGVPAALPAFRDHIRHAADVLRGGDAVLLHCAAGIGRTGSAGACLLKELGWPPTQALQAVRDAGSNPESAEQSGLIESF
jgi:protein-tyrosine phosphatase